MYFYDKSLTFVLTNRFSVAIIYAELRRKAVIEKIKALEANIVVNKEILKEYEDCFVEIKENP